MTPSLIAQFASAIWRQVSDIFRTLGAERFVQAGFGAIAREI